MNMSVDIQELSKNIHEKWNDISYEMAMKSENGNFNLTDIANAYHKGVDVVLQYLGIDDNGEYIERNQKGFYFCGEEVSWEEIPLDVRKHDYPYYFDKNGNDCYPIVQE